MYLIIFEDGSLTSVDSINNEDKESSDNGYIDIVSLNEDGNYVQYLSDGWHEISRG